MSAAKVESESVETVTPLVLGDGNGSRNGQSSLAKLEIPVEAIRALPADFVKRHQVLPLKIQLESSMSPPPSRATKG